MHLSGLWQSVTRCSVALQALVRYGPAPPSRETSLDFTFSTEWKVLGPFQIGTREATWGADPLEYYGGFHALEYNPNATYRSSLPVNGTVSWSTYEADISLVNEPHSNADLSIDFSHIDWAWLKEVYGWPAHQWQGWARGEIFVRTEKAEVLILHTEHVLEYWIDDVHHFGGDFYGYKKVPVTLHLKSGAHRIDVRLIRDVRSMGGVGRPSIDVKLELQRSWCGLRTLLDDDEDVLMSDVIGGDFGPIASEYASIIVRNDAEDDIHIHGISGMHETCVLELLSNSSIRLVPGQTRPVGFRIGCVPSYNRRIYMALDYRIAGNDTDMSLHFTTWPRVLETMEEPHKVTFLHSAGMVSYAILRPPSPNIHCGENKNLTLPVLLALHGAGLEADSDIVKHALDDLPDLCAWVLFPTGVAPWSGDDWHNFGLADVEAAVAAIPKWIEQVEWEGPGVDINKWLVSGHSNGGQGTWYALTHRPDKVIAAAVLSGYSSIQNYVPYTFWHTAEPGKEAVIQSALLPYRHELLLENAKGIPVLQQHGSKDENVPVYNARLMNQRIDQAGAASTYIEVPGQGHYWDGVMATKPLKEFFEKQLDLNLNSATGPPLNLHNFSVIVADPGDMGSKHGVEVLRLTIPGKLGRIDMLFDPLTLTCIVHTSNVYFWRVPYVWDDCQYLFVDGQEFSFSTNREQGIAFQRKDKRWNVEDYRVTSSIEERHGRQLGAMNSIPRSLGAFSIVKHSAGTEHIALQISRNLCQYFTADTDITDDYHQALSSTGNIISIAIGADLPQNFSTTYPITVSADGVTIWWGDYGQGLYSTKASAFSEMVAAFLRPLPDERLELVVWATDLASLDIAARLVPMLTGSGQPDFIVTDKTMLRKGVEGTLALGFLDGQWDVTMNSYIT